MSYLIVIITVKKLQNRLHRDETSDRHEDKQMDTKTKQKYRKNNTAYCRCWLPRSRLSVLSTKCGHCHPKGLIGTS